MRKGNGLGVEGFIGLHEKPEPDNPTLKQPSSSYRLPLSCSTRITGSSSEWKCGFGSMKSRGTSWAHSRKSSGGGICNSMDYIRIFFQATGGPSGGPDTGRMTFGGKLLSKKSHELRIPYPLTKKDGNLENGCPKRGAPRTLSAPLCRWQATQIPRLRAGMAETVGWVRAARAAAVPVDRGDQQVAVRHRLTVLLRG